MFWIAVLPKQIVIFLQYPRKKFVAHVAPLILSSVQFQLFAKMFNKQVSGFKQRASENDISSWPLGRI